MGWLGRIFGGGLGSLLGQVGGLIDRFKLPPGEKQKFMLEMETLVQKRDSEIEETIRAELGAKERVLVAELQQGDNYTKRARPTVVYAGLVFIFLNYCLVPLLGQIFKGSGLEELKLPNAFWAGWSGIVGTWSIGRTFEKRGSQSRLVRSITGSSGGFSRLLGDEEPPKG